MVQSNTTGVYHMSSFTGLYMKIFARHADLRTMEQPVRTILRDMDCANAPEDIDRISLAVHELCVHIIGQGLDTDATLTVVVEPQEHGYAVRVIAPCPNGRYVQAQTDLIVEGDVIDNLAFWTAQHLMDEVTVDSQTGYDTWRMVKHSA